MFSGIADTQLKYVYELGKHKCVVFNYSIVGMKAFVLEQAAEPCIYPNKMHFGNRQISKAQ